MASNFCYDCNKIIQRCPNCHLPNFYLAKGNFEQDGEPTYRVIMEIDGTRFALDDEFTKTEVKTHFNLTPPVPNLPYKPKPNIMTPNTKLNTELITPNTKHDTELKKEQ